MLSHLIESVPERGRFRKNLPGDQPGVRGARARSGAAHRYRPGRVRGQPVRVLVQVPITFSLKHLS